MKLMKATGDDDNFSMRTRGETEDL